MDVWPNMGCEWDGCRTVGCEERERDEKRSSACGREEGSADVERDAGGVDVGIMAVGYGIGDGPAEELRMMLALREVDCETLPPPSRTDGGWVR